MLFTSAATLILSTLTAYANAQQAFNQILNPGANSVIQAGGGTQSLTWTNLTNGNVSVSLFSGANPVVEVVPILVNVPNTGTALWTPETWLPSANDYLIGVTDLTGSAPIQYSPYFTIQLCSTCSSSTRASTSSFATQTVSVSNLNLGTRSAFAFPSIAAAAQSGSASETGVVASGVSSSSRTASGMAGGTAAASSARALASSMDAILSMTALSAGASGTSGAAAATSSRAGAESERVAIPAMFAAVIIGAML